MTQKYLVLGSPRPNVTRADTSAHLVAEVETVWRNYLNGLIREIYEREDGGVVMVVEAPDRSTVEAMIAALPLAKEGFLDVQVIGLKPFALWSVLFAQPITN